MAIITERSIVLRYTLVCDECGKQHYHVSDTIDDALRTARAWLWEKIDGKLLCAKCVKKRRDRS